VGGTLPNGFEAASEPIRGLSTRRDPTIAIFPGATDCERTIRGNLDRDLVLHIDEARFFNGACELDWLKRTVGGRDRHAVAGQ
jgi:hypothetical protein